MLVILHVMIGSYVPNWWYKANYLLLTFVN
jgi:hypothetical protein